MIGKEDIVVLCYYELKITSYEFKNWELKIINCSLLM